MATRNTASFTQYIKRHNENIHKQSPGSIYDTTMFSITVLEFYKDNLYYLRDIIYIPLDDCYKKYILDACDKYPAPYEHLSVVRLDILRDRIMIKLINKDNCDNNDNKDNIDKYFKKFCEEKIEENELLSLENLMHIDDHLLTDWHVPSEFNLREKALSIINKSENGSWLVRRSSVAEQSNVKVRVITFKKIPSNEIRHYLFAQINGLGYVLTHGFSGDSFPNIGDDKPIFISSIFRSLPELLTHMKGEGLILDRIVKS